MKIEVSSTDVKKQTVYHKFLIMLCWLRVIPVSLENHKFKIISVQTILSSLWTFVPWSYYIYYKMALETTTNEVPATTVNSTIPQAQSDNKSSELFFQSSMDNALFTTYLILTFCLMLFLPLAQGHFFEHNASSLLTTRFQWPSRGWMLALSSIICPLLEVACLSFSTALFISAGMPTSFVVHFFLVYQIINFAVAFLQLSSIMLVNSRQADFMMNVDKSMGMTKDVETFSDLIEQYENIRRGVGPFYALQFCFNAPIFLCFAYFIIMKIAYRNFLNNMVVWSMISAARSSIVMVHICLTSADCYEVLQCLTPAIR